MVNSTNWNGMTTSQVRAFITLLQMSGACLTLAIFCIGLAYYSGEALLLIFAGGNGLLGLVILIASFFKPLGSWHAAFRKSHLQR